jgi:hypothetical protein
MNINGIDLANFNSNSRIMPYLFKADGLPTEYKDSPIEVIPPFPGFEGGFGGIQTHIGMQISPINTLSIAPFGFKFVNNFIQGGGSYIGDINGFYSSSVLQMFQFPNQALFQFTLTDNYNFQRYINIVPNAATYGIGDDATSISNMNAGFIIDGSNGIGACYLGQGFGLEFSSIQREVKIGDIANYEYIGVDTQTPAMIVSSNLMENPPDMKIVNFIRVRDESNNFYYIPLYN